MSFRIERLVGETDFVVLRVSGRIHGEHVDTLRLLIEREKGGVAIDLREVILVDREAELRGHPFRPSGKGTLRP
jgi:anti-anti-sigma regulatory factor